jgi:hypothetical protein
MIDTQQQYINLNIHGEISIIVVQAHSGRKRDICKRHLESMLKGIKSYLCLVQTGHVNVEGILFGTWKGIRAFG